MSKYTTEVRYICEAEAGYKDSVGFNDIDSVIAGARQKIFNFEYGIFDNEYRSTLETKILRHYYTREIGLETYGLWKLKLQAKLTEIMPYYNQLYESAKLEFNPFYDVDYIKGHEGEIHSTRTDDLTHTFNNTSTDNTNRTNKYSDTPQGNLTGMITDENMYLTNATIDNISSNTVNNGTSNDDGTVKNDGNDKYNEAVKGKIGTTDYSTLLKRYRETFINIDLMVINELEELFFQLW